MTAIKTAFSVAALMLISSSLPFLARAAGGVEPTF